MESDVGAMHGVLLGRWVGQRRKALGLTQEQLAERMDNDDIDGNWITQLETGRKKRLPEQPAIGQLAHALRVAEIEVLRGAGVITEEPVSPGIAESTPVYDVSDARHRISQQLATITDPRTLQSIAEYVVFQQTRDDLRAWPEPAPTPSEVIER